MNGARSVAFCRLLLDLVQVRDNLRKLRLKRLAKISRMGREIYRHCEIRLYWKLQTTLQRYHIWTNLQASYILILIVDQSKFSPFHLILLLLLSMISYWMPWIVIYPNFGCADETLVPPVLHTIRNRYAQHMIYTYSGIVLIAVNPFQRVTLYGPEIIQAYSGRRKGELEPHLFAIAEDAYTRMSKEGQGQTIIVSGERSAQWLDLILSRILIVVLVVLARQNLWVTLVMFRFLIPYSGMS